MRISHRVQLHDGAQAYQCNSPDAVLAFASREELRQAGGSKHHAPEIQPECWREEIRLIEQEDHADDDRDHAEAERSSAMSHIPIWHECAPASACSMQE